MDTVLLNNQQADQEPIPGYKLKERVGFGGYGEVWSAEAPGGLEKAIKFVFGQLTEDRAKRELKSLNRIKEVHHPFLLNLERIEIAKGQLIIVTELAEGSMKDRFDTCIENRLRGIPHKELIRHLRDAADALDYIYETQSLQHLDIKPENLLLLGGRVKVADFGLLKDLQQVDASLMDALTPKYAAPELFDGRPSCHSDQYSLAIVYQEMLTGVSPFDGRTCAQLAVQHLHKAPNVEPLPWSDRAVVERAMAKSPDDRYPDCRTFIDELIQSSKQDSTTAMPVPALPDLRDSSEILAPDLDDPIEAPKPRPIVRAEARKPRDDVPQQQRPALVIGLGSCGADLLFHLQQQLDTRFGPHADVPAIAKLFIDTDPDSLQAAADKQSAAGRNSSQFLLTRLRSGREYSAEYQTRFQSIDRRWIYNVPRSRQSEGIRALGRLALLDNYDNIAMRVHEALRQLISPATLDASATSTGIDFGDCPHIMLLSSIGGGLGSGMLIDLAYLVRRVLQDLRITNYELGAVTTLCGTNQRPYDLTAAAAHAFMKELRYFDNHVYPGDPACGIDSLDVLQPPFDYLYLQDWGRDRSPNELPADAHALGSYLAQRVIGPAARQLSLRDASGPRTVIRSTSSIKLHETEDLPSQIAKLSEELLQSWLGEQHRTGESNADRHAWQASTGAICEQWMAENLPPLPELLQLSKGELTGRVKQDLSEYAHQFVEHHLTDWPGQMESIEDQLTDLQNKMLERVSDSELPVLQPVLRKMQLSFCHTLAQFLDEWVEQLLNTAEVRIGGVRMAIDMVRLRLEELSTSLRENNDRLGKAVIQRRQQLASLAYHWQQGGQIAKGQPITAEHVHNLATQFIQDVIDELISQEVARGIRLVQNHLEDIVQRSRMWQANLHQVLGVITKDSPPTHPIEHEAPTDEDVQNADRERLDQVIADSPNWDLSVLLDDSRFHVNDLLDAIQVMATRQLTGAAINDWPDDLSEILQDNLPQLAKAVGGSAELFWIVPPTADLKKSKADAESHHQDIQSTVLVDSALLSPQLIWEVGQIDSAHVADHILEGSPERLRMSDRLATRVDLQF